MSRSHPLHHATILVVDDDELNRRFVSVMLAQPGYTFLLAENGQQALALIENRHIDIMLLDINMPVLNGIDTLRRLRERFSLLELPVIMFTADDDEDRIIEVLNLGANDYLVKPVKPAIASARIKTQLSISALSKLKDDFLRFASHDLKKPMLVMQDIIEAARELDLAERAQHSELSEHLALLDNTNRRMQEVVHGFLDQNRLQASDAPEQIDLNELIQEARDFNHAYALKKHIHLRIEMSPGLPSLRVEGFKVRQVLENLIGNAIKFCPPQATVIVRSLLRDAEVLIEVIDNGPGLTAEDYRKLFQRGVTLSNQPTGKESSSGIGLPLCKDMIESVGGRIGARPADEGGAIFWISFTAFPAQAALLANSTHG